MKMAKLKGKGLMVNFCQVLGQEPRQTTSVLGHLQKPSIQALIHGLNRSFDFTNPCSIGPNSNEAIFDRHYYSIAINYRKTELEQTMLMNLHKKNWVDGLTLRSAS